MLIGKTCFSQFLGGSNDGYDKAGFMNSTNIYAGGTLDGYSIANYTNLISIYKGSKNDGHNVATFTNPISIFRGSEDDGHHYTNYINPISIFTGGTLDGYDIGEKLVSYIWTGNIGTGWNVEDNWSGGFIPNLNSSVIIPSGVTNFPKVNDGLIAVAEDPSGLATYFCKQILIEPSAEMTLRVNAFMENYGEIEIYGSMFVLNSAIDAVQNLNGGLITIKRHGLLEF